MKIKNVCCQPYEKYLRKFFRLETNDSRWKIASPRRNFRNGKYVGGYKKHSFLIFSKIHRTGSKGVNGGKEEGISVTLSTMKTHFKINK